MSGAAGRVAATLSHHVSGVVRGCAEEPVGRVLAWRVVAGVTDPFPWWDRPDEEFVAVAVREDRPFGFAESELAVSVSVSAGGPWPAFIWSTLVDLGVVTSGRVFRCRWHVYECTTLATCYEWSSDGDV